MNDLLPARIEAIRARVQTLSDRILSRVNAARADDDHIHASAEAYFVASPNVVTAVGRVRVELDGSEGVVAGRINPSSVVMESVDGNLLKLDLRRINEAKVPLFLNPGMVVAAEGVNLNGRCMDVHAIYDNCMPVVDRARSTGNATQDDVDTPVASIIVAAGPFTTMDNLKYEPLDELLQVVIRERPHLVLLTGPFVDVAHPHITHATSVPFETVFEKRVLQRIVDARKKMAADGGFGSEFILVPSLDDVNHEPVCPQPRFEFSHTSVGATEVHVVANPCVMKVMSKDEKFEASIGISSLPALQDISADSLCWNKSDRLAAIVSHMLRQQSFYPTFPPGKGVPLDCTMLDGLDVPESNTCPSVDMMIMPSRLKAFAKCVDAGAVGVNPGLSCRGNSGGTYAEICVALHPCDRPRPPNWNEDRTEVGVIRL